jgi:4'-phosphopantetheinyl transferase EntD
MDAIAPAGVRIGCRHIRQGDELYLLPREAGTIRATQPAVRQASGAGRFVARRLLAELGFPDFEIVREPSGAPVWPAGIIGSIAHDDEMAVAAVARLSQINALGIDVEVASPLPDDVSEIVANADDITGSVDPSLAGRILFAAKEAVYKAVYPLDRKVLGYEDITVDLNKNLAVTEAGRQVKIAFCVVPRVAVIAYS